MYRVKCIHKIRLVTDMTDLVCKKCGFSAKYMQAYRHDTEDIGPCSHEWVRPIHNGIDIVLG